jgi:hypothetical protein
MEQVFLAIFCFSCILERMDVLPALYPKPGSDVIRISNLPVGEVVRVYSAAGELVLVADALGEIGGGVLWGCCGLSRDVVIRYNDAFKCDVKYDWLTFGLIGHTDFPTLFVFLRLLSGLLAG